MRKILTTKTPVTFTSIAINNICHRWLGQVDRERIKKKLEKQDVFRDSKEWILLICIMNKDFFGKRKVPDRRYFKLVKNFERRFLDQSNIYPICFFSQFCFCFNVLRRRKNINPPTHYALDEKTSRVRETIS